MNRSRALPALSLALIALLLAACGGGGGGGAAPPPAAGRCANGVAVFTFGDSGAATGKAVGAAVGGCSAGLTDIAWAQTGGPQTVTLLSAQTPAISFDAPAAGIYQFLVSYRLGGNAQSSEVAVTVATPAAPPASTITVRADQAVRKGGNTSLRAWPDIAAGDTRQSITWQQIEGPAVTLDVADPLRAIFQAPEVGTDTLLRFRATLRTTGGVTDSDEVAVLVENHPQAPTDASGDPYVWSGAHVSRVHAYERASPLAADLARCVYAADLQFDGDGKNLCPLTTLPFLHQSTGGDVPTTAQIMDRVLVSHDWMGAAFEEFLDSAGASADLKRLFNGVTAVVIGAHVRPSFYYALTGAIYLDADNFWRTATERDVIDETPDFRSDFDIDLQYTGLWRYTESNANIFLFFPATSRLARDTGYLRNELTWLLYHELAHASDFMPAAARTALNSTVSAWDNIAPRFTGRQLVSDTLGAALPLRSAEMRALATVKFVNGPAASDATLVNNIPYGTLKAYTPATAAAFFAAEGASDEYNYHPSTREDVAMLFEEFMQRRNHALLRDVAFTTKAGAGSTGNTLLVAWGQRGRVGDTNVRPRVQHVVQALAPWVDISAVTSLPAPLQMRTGESWNANLCLPGPCAAPLVTAQRALPLALDAEQALLARAMRQPPLHVTVPGLADRRLTPHERVLQRLRGG